LKLVASFQLERALKMKARRLPSVLPPSSADLLRKTVAWLFATLIAAKI